MIIPTIMRCPRCSVAVFVVALATWVSASPQPPLALSRGVTQGRGGQTPPQAAPPPPPPTGVISGRITDAISKAPIARVRVLLSADCDVPAVPGGPACTPVLPQNRVAITGDDGRFRLTGLPAAGNFLLRATATGYAPAGYGELPPATRPVFIALKAGQEVETANIELSPEVVLAGMVQDEDGKPFAGAFIEALRAIYTEGKRELIAVAEAVTDDRGQFRLTQMPPGQYYVSAFDPAFANVGDAVGQLFYSPTFYPSATTPEEATRITLDPGVSKDAILIQLKLIRPSRVGGQLRPAMGRTLAAGAIELGPQRNDQYASLSNYRVDIKPDGSYLFANVPPGKYVIRARGETQGDSISMFGLFNFEVSGTDRTAIDVAMNAGAVVSGFVDWERKGRTSIPAERQTIIVRAPMQDGSLSGDAPTGNLQPDGTFRMKGVLQGDHYFRLENLPAPWSLKRVEIAGADVTDIPYYLRYGQVENGVRITLTDVSTTLFGTILPRRGDVLQGYAVIAFSTNPGLWYPRSRHVVLQRPVNFKGSYKIETLPPGEYHVAATRDYDEADIFNPKALRQLAASPGLKRIVIREGEQKLCDLQPLLR